ncbi:MAG: aminoglycoside N(3)-acetyltransferase [Candidatus Pristimantibacillus sp.]
MNINESDWPVTVSSLTSELGDCGIVKGMNIIVHASFKSLECWVVGGVAAVIQALEEVIGDEGTLVMPTHSSELSDPASWMNPPVPESWWNTIREEMPAYDKSLTPTNAMGVIAENFRKQEGALRSDHPQLSFAARGPEAAFITDNHSLADGLGECSPLARMYDRNGWVLLIGVDYDKNTSLHLSEHRAAYAGKQRVKYGAPCMVDEYREWIEFEDINYSTEDFIQIGQSFEQSTELVQISKIGNAVVRLMPQRQLVDYGVRWIESNRI